MRRNSKLWKKRMERDRKVRKRREANKYNYGQSETCTGFQEKARVERTIYEEFETWGWLSIWK